MNVQSTYIIFIGAALVVVLSIASGFFAAIEHVKPISSPIVSPCKQIKLKHYRVSQKNELVRCLLQSVGVKKDDKRKTSISHTTRGKNRGKLYLILKVESKIVECSWEYDVWYFDEGTYMLEYKDKEHWLC